MDQCENAFFFFLSKRRQRTGWLCRATGYFMLKPVDKIWNANFHQHLQQVPRAVPFKLQLLHCSSKGQILKQRLLLATVLIKTF